MTRESLSRANEIVSMIDLLDYELKKISYSIERITHSDEEEVSIRICDTDKHVCPTKDELLTMMCQMEKRYGDEIGKLKKELEAL